MPRNIVPINAQRHANKRVKPINRFTFAAKTYIVSLITNEFNKIASTYPIVFVEDGTDLKPFALLGLEKGENLFVDAEGNWNAPYIPAIIRRHPFALGRNEGSSDLILCIDEGSEFISEAEGEPLFDENGGPGAIIETAKNFLIELPRFHELTDLFSKKIRELDLLDPLKMQIRNSQGDMVRIDGIYGINEEKLNALSDETFLELRKRGALSLIYAHLISLSQMERLVALT